MVLDKRAKRLARILVNHSTSIQPDDTLLIRSEDCHKGFVEEIKKAALKKNASVIIDYFNLKERKAMIERDSIDEMKKESERVCRLLEECTATIKILSLSNPLYLLVTKPDKVAHYYEYVIDTINEKVIGYGNKPGLKWNLLEIPCRGQAVLAGMNRDKYANFVYASTNRGWYRQLQEMKKIKEIFDRGNKIRIVVPKMTDFKISLKGRGGFIEDGKINMPGGEVFYGPVENSANGHISFPYPVVRGGTVITGMKLHFKDGKVTEFEAEENEQFLQSMLEISGAKKIGEFAVGTNYKVTRYVRNLSFDEKIGGTFHIGLGKSYPYLLSDGGGLNKSELHWDIVCDLRKTKDNPGGNIYVDGVLVQKNGKWVFDIPQKKKS